MIYAFLTVLSWIAWFLFIGLCYVCLKSCWSPVTRRKQQNLERDSSHFIQSKVVSGLGRASHFLQIPYYKNHIEQAIHKTLFPGTLNLQLPCPYSTLTQQSHLVLHLPSNTDHGGFQLWGPFYFTFSNKAVSAYKAWLLRPEKTTLSLQTSEWIADCSLREYAQLKDGDEVRIITCV